MQEGMTPRQVGSSASLPSSSAAIAFAHRHPLGGCRVGKLDLRADVAYGVDAGHGGRERLVYRNSSPLDGKLRALAEQSRGIGTATDGDKHARRRDAAFLSLCFVVDGEVVALFGDFLHHGGGTELDAPFFQDHGEVLGDLLIHNGKDPVKRLHDGNLASEGGVDAGDLHADHAAADDHKGGEHRGTARKKLVRGHDAGKGQTRDGRLCGNRAGGEDHPVGG